MDAAEWDASTDPEAMVVAIAHRTSARKLRLATCASVRQGWSLLADERLRAAVEVGERFADDGAMVEELRRAYREAMTAHYELNLPVPSEAWTLGVSSQDCASDMALGVEAITRRARMAAARPQAMSTGANDLAVQARILRDVVGNPFRPVIFDPAWRAGPAPDLAETAYTERLLPSGELDPARLAVLADALEDNGADPGILAHLRAPGPHVRGCWAVDLCTGRG
jgi:hypothetical protein